MDEFSYSLRYQVVQALGDRVTDYYVDGIVGALPLAIGEISNMSPGEFRSIVAQYRLTA